MNAPASGDSFTRRGVDGQGRTRNAQLTNELKAGGGKGRNKAKSPSLRDCGCPFSADPQKSLPWNRGSCHKSCHGTGGVGAATAGGFERSSIRMHNRNDTTSTIEANSRSYAESYAAYVQEIPNVRSQIDGRGRDSYASYASYAVCDGGVCAHVRSLALDRARYGRWGGKNRVRCVRYGLTFTPSCGYNLTLPRKMASEGKKPNVRFGGAA